MTHVAFSGLKSKFLEAGNCLLFCGSWARFAVAWLLLPGLPSLYLVISRQSLHQGTRLPAPRDRVFHSVLK